MGDVKTNNNDPVKRGVQAGQFANRLNVNGEFNTLVRKFDYADQTTLRSKLAEIQSTTAPVELWADFDNTLTARSYGIYEALRNALPPLGQTISDAERRANLAKERDGSLSMEEYIAWTKHEIGRYAQYGITTEDIIRAVEAVRLRAGVRRLFSYCDKTGINRHIVSASIADAIELVGLQPSHIHSNKLHIKDGVVIGWDEENILHAHNKQLRTKVILSEANEIHTSGWKVVLGDTKHDANMIPGNKVLRIRVRGKNGNSEAYLADSFTRATNGAAYDLVLRTESLSPIVRLLRGLAKN